MNTAQRWVGIAMAAGAAWGLSAGGATYYVDTNWSSAGSGTTGDPYWKLGDAIGAANLVAGPHAIYVADGVYAASGSGGRETFGTDGYTVGGQAFTIQGGYTGYTGSGFDWVTRSPRTSVIDLTGANSRALYRSPVYAGAAFTVDGITFRNSSVSQASYDGGVIFYNADNGGLISISDCAFQNNVTTGTGGAVYFKSGDSSGPNDPRVLNSTFSGNRAATGGALFIQCSNAGYGQAQVSGTVFSGNTATGTGGGLYALNTNVQQSRFLGNAAADGGGLMPSNVAVSQSLFTGNTVTGNGAAIGGPAAYDGGGASIVNSLITGNTGPAGSYAIYLNGHQTPATIMDMAFTTVADNTGGIYGRRGDGGAAVFQIRDSIVVNNAGSGIVVSADSTGVGPVLTYDDVWNNSGGNYGGKASAGAGSLSSNPLFAAGGYELTSGSPATDSGMDLGVVVDIRGRIRPYPVGATGYDMGAYELPEPAGFMLLFASGSLLATRRRRR